MNPNDIIIDEEEQIQILDALLDDQDEDIDENNQILEITL